MRRKILAILSFNVYAAFLVPVFQVNTVYLFDANLLLEMNPSGFDLDPVWGDHYLYRLIAGVVVTALVGFLAGAISKEKGGNIAALANIPSILIWGVMAYVILFGIVEIKSSTGFLVISIIAIRAIAKSW